MNYIDDATKFCKLYKFTQKYAILYFILINLVCCIPYIIWSDLPRVVDALSEIIVIVLLVISDRYYKKWLINKGKEKQDKLVNAYNDIVNEMEIVTNDLGHLDNMKYSVDAETRQYAEKQYALLSDKLEKLDSEKCEIDFAYGEIEKIIK